MTVDALQASLARPSIFELFRRPESYWDSLTAEAKEGCIDRTKRRKLCNSSAFDVAGLMQKKWNTDIYPQIRTVLHQEKATIFNRMATETPFSVQLYILESGSDIRPSVVVICYVFDVAQRIVKLVKHVLRDQSIGFKYYALKSLVCITGGAGSDDCIPMRNVCGTCIQIKRPNMRARKCTIGGCILLNQRPFGLTSAHVMAEYPDPVPIASSNEEEELTCTDDMSQDSHSNISSNEALSEDPLGYASTSTTIGRDVSGLSLNKAVPPDSRNHIARLQKHIPIAGTQFNLRDDWLLIPLRDRGQCAYNNVIHLADTTVCVRGSTTQPLEDKSYLYLGYREQPVEARVSSTSTVLYLPAASRLIDVWACDHPTCKSSSIKCRP